jgi:hypothetical protein
MSFCSVTQLKGGKKGGESNCIPWAEKSENQMARKAKCTSDHRHLVFAKQTGKGAGREEKGLRYVKSGLGTPLPKRGGEQARLLMNRTAQVWYSCAPGRAARLAHRRELVERERERSCL